MEEENDLQSTEVGMSDFGNYFATLYVGALLQILRFCQHILKVVPCMTYECYAGYFKSMTFTCISCSLAWEVGQSVCTHANFHIHNRNILHFCSRWGKPVINTWCQLCRSGSCWSGKHSLVSTYAVYISEKIPCRWEPNRTWSSK